MFWKTFLLAFLAVGAFANQLELSAGQKDKIKDAVTQACTKAGAVDKTDDVNKAVIDFVDCVKPLINPAEVLQEIEAAKPNGALDEVFKKYCAKTPQLKTCISNLMDGATPCVEASARPHLNESKVGTDQLIDFVCYKDGDRIALFIAEHGPECFQSKADAIKTCAENLTKRFTNVEEAKNLTMVEKCTLFDNLGSCVVTALEGCDTPTPANMAEALLKYVRKSTECNTAVPPKN